MYNRLHKYVEEARSNPTHTLIQSAIRMYKIDMEINNCQINKPYRLVCCGQVYSAVVVEETKQLVITDQTGKLAILASILD